MNECGLKFGKAKSSALKAIVLGLVILSDLAGSGQAFSAGANAASPVVGSPYSTSIIALAELPRDFGPPSPGPTDPNGPFPGP